MDGRANEWMDGWMDGWIKLPTYACRETYRRRRKYFVCHHFLIRATSWRPALEIMITLQCLGSKLRMSKVCELLPMYGRRAFESEWKRVGLWEDKVFVDVYGDFFCLSFGTLKITYVTVHIYISIALRNGKKQMNGRLSLAKSLCEKTGRKNCGGRW